MERARAEARCVAGGAAAGASMWISTAPSSFLRVARPLSELTTLRLGGPPRRLVEAATEDELVVAGRACDADSEPLLLLAGGSNLVVADEGFAGTVVRILTRGVDERALEGGVVRVEVQAGEGWDPLVGAWVERGLTGVECLAGIPGSVGATPIQNVGAYGQEIADTLVSVRALDRRTDSIDELGPEDCGFTYRSSAFKREPGRWVVLSVSYALERSARSRPIRYAELARALDVEPGSGASLPAVREAVLALRRSKGMVVDPSDPDSVSAGSFFTNPILSAAQFQTLADRAGDPPPPAWPEEDGHVKTSAAWLIEHAGFHRGHGNPDGIAISGKHTLALTNRGAGSTSELLALAREIAAGVRKAFGVELVPEPVL